MLNRIETGRGGRRRLKLKGDAISSRVFDWFCLSVSGIEEETKERVKIFFGDLSLSIFYI